MNTIFAQQKTFVSYFFREVQFLQDLCAVVEVFSTCCNPPVPNKETASLAREQIKEQLGEDAKEEEIDAQLEDQSARNDSLDYYFL